MTTSQEREIARLTRILGIGSHATHGIKAVLGKVPIKMSEGRAEQVIEELASRLPREETEAGKLEQWSEKNDLGW